MPHAVRVIPRLDIKGPNLVKGIHLEGLRVLGAPEQFAKYYYETGADELLYMDVVASLYGRNSLHEIITKTASEVFIPLIVGGGLRTLDDIRNVLKAGADKVALNTAVIKNPKFVSDAARKFGSSTIIISIEAIKQSDGRYLAYTDNGREFTGVEVLQWAKKCEELGAGEIMITSIDREGTGKGFEIELTRMISDNVSVPVIACGGAGTYEHVGDVVERGHADAVAIASMLHYDYVECHRDVLNASVEGNTDFLRSGMSFLKVNPGNMAGIKEYLHKNNCECRLAGQTEEIHA